MVDALTLEGDEGRGVAAISLGEVPSNLRSGDFRMGKPHWVNLNDRAHKKENFYEIIFMMISYPFYVLGAYPLKWSISVSGGEEKKAKPSINEYRIYTNNRINEFVYS